MANKPLAMLFNGVWSQYVVATAPKYRDWIDLVYLYDFAAIDLSRYRGLIIPFQMDHQRLAEQQHKLYDYLAQGGQVVVFGDAGVWLDAQWQDRPVNNYWWKDNPDKPPVTDTDFSHPLFAGLTPRQTGWHNHGVYTRVPASAEVLQRSDQGEIVCWQTTEYGGVLLAATQDPIVEHGVQQIAHLDHFVDRLLYWLSGELPAAEKLTLDPQVWQQPLQALTRA